MELVPLVVLALVGGAIADRYDRRRVLPLNQVALVACAAALAAGAVAGEPPLAVLYVLGGLLAGFAAVRNVTRSAIIPNLGMPRALLPVLALTVYDAGPRGPASSTPPLSTGATVAAS